MTDMMINQLFNNNRVWLSEIDCINWGTFNGHHSAVLTPEGLMVTGETGSGKSTFIDGYITLLQGTNGRYNVAAAQDGESRDRDVVSYVRGYFASSDSAENDCLRGDTVVSVIRAKFTFEDGRSLIAALILSIDGTSRAKADVKRLYLLMNDDIAVKDLYRGYAEDKTRFKRQLSQDNRYLVHTETYKEYRSHLLQSLGIENENAIDLLCRAMGLKQIRNLDEMLRSLVLEEGDFKLRAKASLEESSALHEINDAILDAEAQIEELSMIQDEHERHAEATKALKEAEADKLHAESFFAHATLPHLSRTKDISQRANLEAKEALETSRALKPSLEDEIQGYRAEFESLGGHRIEALEKEAESAREILTSREERARSYTDLTRSLSLVTEISQANFEHNRAQKTASLNTIEASHADTRSALKTASHELINVENEIKERESEIEDLSKRRSNVPMPYQKLRDEISDDLSIDPEDLIYMAELMKVRPSEAQWQSAIERALGMRKLTLLVPEGDERSVTEYVNRRHLGLNFKARSVRADDKFVTPTFKETGFLRKIEWKKHPYRETVKDLLAHIDLQCVAESELSATPHSMTQEGLIQYEKGQFAKNDRHRIDDKTQWSLGFSSQDRINVLNDLLSNLKPRLTQLRETLKSLETRREALSNQKSKWEQLDQYTWDAINFLPKKKELARLTEQLNILRQNQNDTALAERKMKEAKERLDELEKTIEDQIQNLTRKSDAFEKVSEEYRNMAMRSDGFGDIEEAIRLRLQEYCTDLSEITDAFIIIETAQKDLMNALRAIDKKLNVAREDTKNAERNTVTAMKRYKTKENWEKYSNAWGLEFDHRHDYLEHYTMLVNEGLPDLKDRFQKKLNSQTTSSLSSLLNHYRDERLEIQDRIDSINEVLERTNFTPRSLLRIDIAMIKSVMVLEFEAKVQKVLQLASTANESLDSKRLFKALEEVNVLLREALSNPDRKDNKELLDVRHQMSFTAVEIDRETGAQLNRFGAKGTKGKSGGEKESFTGIILAASLAYVLTPDGSSKVGFSTVFLDEAFSNMSAVIIRRVIQVFKEMGLVLNIITPFKNMDIAKDAASSVLIADKDAGKNQSRLIQMSWEEAENQLHQHLSVNAIHSNERSAQKNKPEEYGITIDE